MKTYGAVEVYYRREVKQIFEKGLISGIFLGVKGDQTARKADSFTTIHESIVWKMWEPRRLTTQRTTMA
jgi:hypothetical protein